MPSPTRGRRPGPSTTRLEILTATKECLHELGFDQITLRKIAARAGVSDSLLVHLFGSRDALIAEALNAPQGLEAILKVLRTFPRPFWGKVIAEGVRRGRVRDASARENLALLMRASTHSEVGARLVSEWVIQTLTPEFAALGLTQPAVRARAFTTVMFGATFSNDILSLGTYDAKQKRAQTTITARVLQAVLAGDL